MPALPDLVTQPYVASNLTAQPTWANINPWVSPILPQLTTAASRMVRKHCNRDFSRNLYDELYTIDPGGTLLLRQYPVNSVKLYTDPIPAITITQTNVITNQLANVGLSWTGGQDEGQVITGITLQWTGNGVNFSQNFTFATLVTIAALCASINAVGQGWLASPENGLDNWPTALLRQYQTDQPALSPDGAEFLIHQTPVKGATFDTDSGIINILGPAIEPTESLKFGPFMSSFDNPDLQAAFLGYRVVYSAGFDTIPEDLQQATVEIVKAMIERLQTDTTLRSESDGVYQWEGREVMPLLPPSARATLDYYKSHRA